MSNLFTDRSAHMYKMRFACARFHRGRRFARSKGWLIRTPRFRWQTVMESRFNIPLIVESRSNQKGKKGASRINETDDRCRRSNGGQYRRRDRAGSRAIGERSGGGTIVDKTAKLDNPCIPYRHEHSWKMLDVLRRQVPSSGKREKVGEIDRAVGAHTLATCVFLRPHRKLSMTVLWLSGSCWRTSFSSSSLRLLVAVLRSSQRYFVINTWSGVGVSHAKGLAFCRAPKVLSPDISSRAI